MPLPTVIIAETPAELVEDCVDPGVTPIATVADAVSVIAANRTWAVCERGKRRDIVQFNVDQRQGLMGNGR